MVTNGRMTFRPKAGVYTVVVADVVVDVVGSVEVVESGASVVSAEVEDSGSCARQMAAQTRLIRRIFMFANCCESRASRPCYRAAW